MSDAMKGIREKLLGNSHKTIEGETAKPNAMMLGLLKSLGVDPEHLLAQADEIKNAVQGRLANIDDKLDNILAICRTNEMKLAEIESNQGVILAALKDGDHESQFAQMAEHPLTNELVIPFEQKER